MAFETSPWSFKFELARLYFHIVMDDKKGGLILVADFKELHCPLHVVTSRVHIACGQIQDRFLRMDLPKAMLYLAEVTSRPQAKVPL